jgi:hypothetical protein
MRARPARRLAGSRQEEPLKKYEKWREQHSRRGVHCKIKGVETEPLGKHPGVHNDIRKIKSK